MSALSTFRRQPQTPQGPVIAIATGFAVVIAVALLGVVCARLAISHYGKPAIEALIGAPVLIAIARRPAVAVVVLLAVVASTFAYGVLPRVNLPGHPPINLADLCLAAAVGGTLLRRPWHSWPVPVRRYLMVLVLMLALMGVATVKTSLLGASQSRDALLNYRNFLYLGVALTIALELRDTLWRRMLDVTIVFAGLVSVLAILAAASGSFAHELQNLSPTTVYSSTAVASSSGVNVGSTARIRVQGLFFIYSMLIPTLVMVLMVKDRWRLMRLGALVLMLAAVGLSLDRNIYGGALVGVLVTALLGGAKVRYRIGVMVAAAAVALAIVISTSIVPAFTAEIGKRASSALNPTQIAQSNSFSDRAYELSFALPSIAHHPWFGVGPRQSYGALYGTKPRFFVQNLYIDLATDYGIPAALAFLLVPGACFVFGLQRVRLAGDPLDRALLAAEIGTLVALSLSCLVDTFVQDPSSTVAYGSTCGLLLAAGLRITQTPISEGANDVRTA
jgi:O-antigen ligase